MILRAELAARITVGEKTVTRRLCTENPRSPWWRQLCALRPGQTFAVQPGRGRPAIARARATSVRREALGRLSDHEARHEGFATAEAFERAFTAINGSYAVVGRLVRRRLALARAVWRRDPEPPSDAVAVQSQSWSPTCAPA